MEFESKICPCTKLIFFQVSDGITMFRLLLRGKKSGRVNDNKATIRKRLQIFREHTKPVLDAYQFKCEIVSKLVKFAKDCKRLVSCR